MLSLTSGPFELKSAILVMYHCFLPFLSLIFLASPPHEFANGKFLRPNTTIGALPDHKSNSDNCPEK